MYNLENTTFIIPLFIESKDRYNNAKTVLGYINKHFKTNVIIHELIKDFTKLDFLDGLSNLSIRHLKEIITDDVYHRTRQLNEMLKIVKTPVVCNYDIDVLLPIESYIISQYLLNNSIFDVVYPYGFGKYQYQVDKNFDRKKFNKNFNISLIEDEFLYNERSEYGHCMFFRTEKYKSIGGENEEFISYGPEDIERYERCLRFNLKLHRIKSFVYHLEHSRTKFSNTGHNNYQNNAKLYESILEMNKEDFFQYYSNLDYLKKYGFDLSKIETNNDFNHKISEVIKVEDPQTNIVFNFPTPPVNRCVCGEPKDKVRYNFCPKCNKLY